MSKIIKRRKTQKDQCIEYSRSTFYFNPFVDFDFYVPTAIYCSNLFTVEYIEYDNIIRNVISRYINICLNMFHRYYIPFEGYEFSSNDEKKILHFKPFFE